MVQWIDLWLGGHSEVSICRILNVNGWFCTQGVLSYDVDELRNEM